MDPPIRKTWPGLIRFPISGRVTPGPEFFRPETKSRFRSVSPARDQISKIVCRTARANAACSRKASVIRDSRNCVVADAVGFEPVSPCIFGKCREILPKCRETAIVPRRKAIRSHKLGWRSPYSRSREAMVASREAHENRIADPPLFGVEPFSCMLGRKSCRKSASRIY